MRERFVLISVAGLLLLGSCRANVATNSNAADPYPTSTPSASNSLEKGGFQAGVPRTVRDFFMLLPEKYFVLEGCDKPRDKDCKKAKEDYLRTFVEVEDSANGYLKGGCDGAQSCMEMTLFKRPDGTYLVGLSTSAEMMEDHYFLDYKNGKWSNVSASAVPEFSTKNMYVLPRYGTAVAVYAKKIVEKGDDYEISEKGEKLYDLEWKNGRFSIKR